jgi:wyosine [tRNA(Phe)-imidazoG37] synthetase (radical SAM superfamily)
MESQKPNEQLFHNIEKLKRETMKNYILGPVPSRRLGKSLGIDLIPPKTCTYNCIYCQIMLDTTNMTLNRKEFVPFDDVIEQLKDNLKSSPDIITITGCGETTLYSRIGELIDKIKSLTNTKIAVLTNGSLLWIPEVREELKNADIVMPNLDAGDGAVYHKINRPHEVLSFEKLVEGLIDFREEFEHQYWLEIFLLQGMNTNDDQIEKLHNIIDRISPDRIQLNTVTKPTWKFCPGAVPKEELNNYCKYFGDNAEIIADYSKMNKENAFMISIDDLILYLKKQPSTLNDISDNFNLNRMEAIKLIDGLCSKKDIKSEKRHGELYYWI